MPAVTVAACREKIRCGTISARASSVQNAREGKEARNSTRGRNVQALRLAANNRTAISALRETILVCGRLVLEADAGSIQQVTQISACELRLERRLVHDLTGLD